MAATATQPSFDLEVAAADAMSPCTMRDLLRLLVAEVFFERRMVTLAAGAPKRNAKIRRSHGGIDGGSYSHGAWRGSRVAPGKRGPRGAFPRVIRGVRSARRGVRGRHRNDGVFRLTPPTTSCRHRCRHFRHKPYPTQDTVPSAPPHFWRGVLVNGRRGQAAAAGPLFGHTLHLRSGLNTVTYPLVPCRPCRATAHPPVARLSRPTMAIQCPLPPPGVAPRAWAPGLGGSAPPLRRWRQHALHHRRGGERRLPWHGGRPDLHVLQ